VNIPYRIETPRLVIRCWSPEDATALLPALGRTRDHLKEFMIWAHREDTLDDIVERLRAFRARFDSGEDFIMGVFDASTAEIVGGAGLHPRVGAGGIEIGYWVASAHVRKGIATETAGALTRVAFEVLKKRWVEIRTAPANVASAGVPPKLGFAYEATLRDRLDLPGGGVADALVFTLLARDYETSAAKGIPLRAYDAAGRQLI
jgi:RimJ/RimL family protein N-acetyltransferase